MRWPRLSITVPVLSLLLTFSTQAQQLDVLRPEQRASLLELYTSEGCSSCPPADRWLSELKNDPRLWKQVVPVAFHVDYWDANGWADRFAFKAAGERQRRYAQYRHIGTVYTPGLVLAGKEWRGWFRRPLLNLGQAPRVGRLHLQVDGPQLTGNFEFRQNRSADLVLNVARLGFELQTEVRTGENEGRILKHDFVVLAYKQFPMTNQGRRYHVLDQVPVSTTPAPRLAMAAWVSAGEDPFPIQAVGGWLQN